MFKMSPCHVQPVNTLKGHSLALSISTYVSRITCVSACPGLNARHAETQQLTAFVMGKTCVALALLVAKPTIAIARNKDWEIERHDMH